jgi:hypothetical protein
MGKNRRPSRQVAAKNDPPGVIPEDEQQKQGVR